MRSNLKLYWIILIIHQSVTTFFNFEFEEWLLSALNPSSVLQFEMQMPKVLSSHVVMILLDDPTYDLDPLNTYFVISILHNHAKKYSRIVMLSMEKPRSDIFPFLDRVTYLSLGEVVYTGKKYLQQSCKSCDKNCHNVIKVSMPC